MSTREEKVIESNRLIRCTGCTVQSAFVSTVSTVSVKKQHIATLNDVKPGDNIINFPGNCIFNMFKPCSYAPKGTWQKSRKTVVTQKQQPLTELSSFLECALGGKITFVKTPDAWAPPVNIVDKAQSKINKAANYVVKKATEVAQAASDAIGGISDVAKKAGGVLKNESVTGALKGTSDLVDGISKKKADLDVTVANLDIRLNNLRKELKQLLTGQQQELQDLMTTEGASIENQDESAATDLTDENKFNNDFFNAENEKAVDDFLTGINNDIDSLAQEGSRLANNNNNNIIPNEGTADSTRIFTQSLPSNSTPPNTTNTPTNPIDRIVDQIDTANEALSPYEITAINASDEAKARQYLAGLDGITGLINKGPKNINSITDVPILYETINVERDELNSKVQAEIDKLLAEIEYAKKLKKYKDESDELQEDLDKAAAALDVVGDFDAFVDGIASKHLGKLLNKYKKGMEKLAKNMSMLNSTLGGLSFMAGGFTAGDVITNVPIEEDNNEDNSEDENDNGTSRAAAAAIDTSALFADNSAITDDRNKEPKVLRMFVIWDQDYEDFKVGELVTLESIPPGTKVCLLIQANQKANGKNVSVNLGDKSGHYEYDGGHQCSVTRQGLFEDIILNGDSPDFENGGKYDLNDPDYAIEGGVKRELSDTTKIKLVSILPEEEEEALE